VEASLTGFVPATVTPVVRRASPDEDVVAAYEVLHGELFAFIARSVRDDAEAEDLLQEAFLRLTREARAGRFPTQHRAWLYRVASNLVISRSRRRGTVARFLDRFGAAEHEATVGESPEAGAIRRERSMGLDAALRQLAPDARAGLLLAAQGFSGAEIAGMLGRSENATRTLLCRARMRVRDLMEGDAA
jgi:RNA polymerase sigma-70 factor, ECF subfamily